MKQKKSYYNKKAAFEMEMKALEQEFIQECELKLKVISMTKDPLSHAKELDEMLTVLNDISTKNPNAKELVKQIEELLNSGENFLGSVLIEKGDIPKDITFEPEINRPEQDINNSTRNNLEI